MPTTQMKVPPVVASFRVIAFYHDSEVSPRSAAFVLFTETRTAEEYQAVQTWYCENPELRNNQISSILIPPFQPSKGYGTLKELELAGDALSRLVWKETGCETRFVITKVLDNHDYEQLFATYPDMCVRAFSTKTDGVKAVNRAVVVPTESLGDTQSVGELMDAGEQTIRDAVIEMEENKPSSQGEMTQMMQAMVEKVKSVVGERRFSLVTINICREYRAQMFRTKDQQSEETEEG